MKARLPKPHRRQFVIGSSPVPLYDNWRYRRLDNHNWISHCPELRISWATDIEGIEWILLGLAIQTRSPRPPMEQITQLSTTEVLSSYADWAGRWLLIGNKQIHLDANGLLGCFYGHNAQGEIWLSSSSVLLSPILKTELKCDRRLNYGQGISWYTPPYSGLGQIKKLLPSQIIDFTSGAIIPRPLMPAINPHSDYQSTITSVKNALVTALQNLGRQEQSLWLGLTAGYDSRLMLAIASGFHTLRQLPATFDSPRQGAEQIAELFNEPQESSAVAGMTAWLNWVQTHPQPYLDWRDRFFLEQRQAGWLSSKEQVYDLTNLTRFPILNAGRIYALLLSIPEAKRLGSLVQVALLKQLAPELLQYPFNPVDDYFHPWVRIAVRIRDNPKYFYWRLKDKVTTAF